jgi:hypothetical protein
MSGRWPLDRWGGLVAVWRRAIQAFGRVEPTRPQARVWMTQPALGDRRYFLGTVIPVKLMVKVIC